ncbi:MAG TPA: hypothetical protein VGD62_02580 [Acidobacteriaceae bacterium]
MQVLCVASNDESTALHCPTCGQGYAVYYSRQSSCERESALTAVRHTLVEHHAHDCTPAAHRALVFNVPAWRGSAYMSAAALLSGAPLAAHADRDRQHAEESTAA